MGDFTVFNQAMEDANAQLAKSVGDTGIILQDLNQLLQRMDTATQNSSVPLWAGLQTQWNNQYSDGVALLASAHLASVRAHDEYKSGDQQTVRIMS